MALISITITTGAPLPIRDADYGAPKHIVPLEVGTAWTVADDGTLLVFWYLETSMLLNLIRQNELAPRVLQLRDLSPWCYLILNSNTLEAHGWPAESIQNALISVQEAGAAVLHVELDRDVPTLIRRIGDRKRTTRRVRPARDVLFFSPGEDMLLAIPGVGSARLDAIMAHAGNSAGAALLVLTDPTAKIPGVPRRVQEDARKALGLEPGVRLALDLIETEEANNDPDTSNTNNGHSGADQLASAAIIAADA